MSARARIGRGREDVDLVAITRDVVGPTVGEILRAGELDSLRLSWAGAVALPDGQISAPTELVLELVCVGEVFTFPLWTIGQVDFSVDETARNLRDALQDFVAESRFGWGQQR